MSSICPFLTYRHMKRNKILTKIRRVKPNHDVIRVYEISKRAERWEANEETVNWYDDTMMY